MLTKMEVGKRFCFDTWRKEVFMDIYNNGEGGFFKEMLREKDNSKNYEKGRIWCRITDMFNQVRKTAGVRSRSCTFWLELEEIAGSSLIGPTVCFVN